MISNSMKYEGRSKISSTARSFSRWWLALSDIPFNGAGWNLKCHGRVHFQLSSSCSFESRGRTWVCVGLRTRGEDLC